MENNNVDKLMTVEDIKTGVIQHVSLKVGGVTYFIASNGINGLLIGARDHNLKSSIEELEDTTYIQVVPIRR